MGPMFSNKPVVSYSPEARQTLLELARTSIQQGLHGDVLRIQVADYAFELQTHRASFVTLHLDRELRGCIGSLEARRPLVLDVAENAQAAAFHDPRFAALTRSEFERIEIHLSILSAPEPLQFASEAELLAQLRPGIDGLILEERVCRSTFLPAVWESLPQPREFLRQLKRKAGLPADFWSDRLTIQRYTAESIP